MAHAFGKVILLGEHSVVYGHPALGVAIGAGVDGEARMLEGASQSTLDVEPWSRHVDLASFDASDALHRAFVALLDAYGEASLAVAVRLRVGLPPRAGLGCSAAVGVAIVRAVDDALGLKRTDEEIAIASLAWENVFHGQPSGVDSMLAACGGVLLYTKGQTPERIRLAKPLWLVVAVSGEYSDTKTMVNSVRALKEREDERVAQVFSAIEALVGRGRGAVQRGELKELGQLLTMNQMLLSSLLLSTPAIEEICAVAQKAGALGAKLTGAGGGGCVVALAPDEATAVAVCDAIQRAGYEGFVTAVGS